MIDAVGNEAIINAGLPLIKMGGSICVYGVIADARAGDEQGSRAVQFQSVHPPVAHPSPRARGPAAALRVDSPGKLSAGEFVTHEFPVEQIDEALAAVAPGQCGETLLKFWQS